MLLSGLELLAQKGETIFQESRLFIQRFKISELL